MVAAADLDGDFLGDGLAGFVDTPFARVDDAREDQRLRALAAFGKTSIDEKLVGSALGQAKVLVKPEPGPRRPRDRARRGRWRRCAWH